jgi:NAD-dependent dihydropyrimidine dehydrogenase PreA subunit
MIVVDTERCSGCGVCVDVCPTGALYLVDGKATVDKNLCNTCQECLAACPNEAIALTRQAERVLIPALRPEPESIQVSMQPLPWHAKVLPVAGAALPLASAALAWTGREILPRLADFLLDTLDRRLAAPQTTGTTVARGREPAIRGARGAGRQYRHRRRGRG